MQSEKSPLYPALVFTGVVVVCTLHVVAGWREMRRDRCVASGANPDWIVVCDVDEIPTNRAAIASSPGGERIAVFRHGNCISAVTNVCAHQGGPLGEGRIIAGCITCPWHGYQYRPSNGRAPSPFTERIHTYNVKIEHGRVMVAATPNPPGTAVEPAIVPPEQRCNVERKVTPLTASHTSSGI
jgi:nitrite reductase/ring-hydroxylating ferredoxin subunit